MGPRKAAQIFALEIADLPVATCRVTLFGSLAATGEGHLTDKAILEVLSPNYPTEIVWKPDVVLPFHTNAMTLEALDSAGDVVKTETF